MFESAKVNKETEHNKSERSNSPKLATRFFMVVVWCGVCAWILISERYGLLTRTGKGWQPLMILTRVLRIFERERRFSFGQTHRLIISSSSLAAGNGVSVTLIGHVVLCFA